MDYSASGLVREIFFVHLAFDVDPLFVNTSPVKINYDGHDWMGAGLLGEIGAPSQNINMDAAGLFVRLSGVPVDRLTEARAEKYRNREAYVYYANLDESWEIVGTPLLVFSGTMDEVGIEAGGSTASIAVQLKSDLAEWARAKNLKYTNEQQQRDYPGDKGLEFVAIQKDNPLNWGTK